MNLRSLVVLGVALGCFSLTVAYNIRSSFDGTNPPHAVDTDGKVIPESSVTQPCKPIILAKDSADDRWGELKPEAAFDHTKHNDATHSLDGKTVSACVECHHPEQPATPSGKPYLKTFNPNRKEVLTAGQLERSKEPVKSCRACHFQESTEPTDEFPPKSVRYPPEMGLRTSGKLTNDTAYHLRCISCHEAALKRDPKTKVPQGCADCHVREGSGRSAQTMMTPSDSTKPPSSQSQAPCQPQTPTPTPTSTPTPTPIATPTPTRAQLQNADKFLDSMDRNVVKLQSQYGAKNRAVAVNLEQLSKDLHELQSAVRLYPNSPQPQSYLDTLSSDDTKVRLWVQKPLAEPQLLKALAEVAANLELNGQPQG